MEAVGPGTRSDALTNDAAMNDRDFSSSVHAPRQQLVDAVSIAPPDGTHIGLWAYLAEVRVIARGGHRSEVRIVRGLFCARNHRLALARAVELAGRETRQLGNVVDVSVTRLW